MRRLMLTSARWVSAFLPATRIHLPPCRRSRSRRVSASATNRRVRNHAMIVSAFTNKHAEEQSMKSIQKWTVGGLLTAVLVTVGFVAAASGLWAQNPGIKRTVVFTGDVSVPGREARIASVEIAPGASAGRHTHPGDEITYVMEGEGEVLIQGQPALKVKAGDGFVVPNGA